MTTKTQKNEQGPSFCEIMDGMGGIASTGRQIGVTRFVAAAWYQRDSIPAKYWGDLVRIARVNKVKGVTAAHLTYLAGQDR